MNKLNLHDKYDFETVLKAGINCCQRKGLKDSFIDLKVDLLGQAEEIRDEVNKGIFDFGRSKVFAINRPKPRLIIAAPPKTRWLHWLVHNDITDYCNSQLIQDTYACIKERGCLAAQKRLETFCRRLTNNWDYHTRHRAYCLQCDIYNYFNSIYRPKVWEIYRGLIGDSSLTAQLHKATILTDPLKNCIIQPNTDLSIIPPHKNVFNAPKNYGLAIGNLPSQNAANLYLDRFDKFVKHNLKAKFYVRYMDDFVLLHSDKHVLAIWREKIQSFLKTVCGLLLQTQKTKIFSVWRGINFAGVLVYPFHTSLRPLTKDSALASAYLLKKRPTVKSLIDSVNSYLGLAQHSHSFYLRRELCNIAHIPSVLACSYDYEQVFYL